jgi:uncharacterized protein YndB with AHSA1/START domain
MIQREAEYPVSPDELWRAVTEPEHLNEWFGGHVDWKPTPGSPLTFVEDDGARWSGVVTDVDPGRSLRFTWWPDDDPHDASTVGFEIEETPDGSGLRITETPVALAARPRHWDHRASSLAAVCTHCVAHA